MLAENPSRAPRIIAAMASHIGRGIPETMENNQATTSPRIAPLKISNGRTHGARAVSGVGSDGRVIAGS